MRIPPFRPMEDIILTARTYRECRIFSQILDTYIKASGDTEVKVMKCGDSITYDFGADFKVKFIPFVQMAMKLLPAEDMSPFHFCPDCNLVTQHTMMGVFICTQCKKFTQDVPDGIHEVKYYGAGASRKCEFKDGKFVKDIQSVA